MTRNKIKVFLAAYVNYPNAQNINCDNIARYLDKDKFEVHVMYTNKMPIDKAFYREQGIHLHKLIHHRFIWYWSKLLTLFFSRCDIYYLPKLESPDKALVKILKGKAKLVGSIEGGVGAQIPADDTATKIWFESLDAVFSISRYIQKSAKKHWNMDTTLLYLGIDLPEVRVIDRQRVYTIVWIGSIIERKHPEILLEIAKSFPKLKFVMVGDGDLQGAIASQIQRESIKNVTLTGRIPNKEVYEIIQKSDLLLMTSDKEGLPKVIGEAMAMSVPAIYINQYYDVDYIQSGINGFAVADIGQMKERISFLLEEPEKYKSMTSLAAESIRPYLWPVLIKQYEAYFETLVQA